MEEGIMDKPPMEMEEALSAEEEEEGEEGAEETEQLRSTTFQHLKSFSLQLLELLQNPSHKHSPVNVIADLLRFLQSSSPSNLQPFFE